LTQRLRGDKVTGMDCPECRRLSERDEIVVRRGPLAVHARPEAAPVPGWLVVAPVRHIEQIDQLDELEARALGPLLAETAAALRQASGGAKIYLAVFAELLPHLHVHVVARPPAWPENERGAALLLSPTVVDPTIAARVSQRALALLAAGGGAAIREKAPPKRSYRAVVLSALVCPGAGQLANKEWLKGGLLVVASLGITIAGVWRLGAMLLARLPSDASADPLAVLEAWSSVQAQAGPALALGGVVLTLLWAYSVWDAYAHTR
jgi:diadenosine tetraphosphate (Ap4A) HIT family hydrolase